MIIDKLNNSFVSLYTYGNEIGYYGNSIEYSDDSITILFFYYSSFTKVYIINGVKEDNVLVQVRSKINIISIYNGVIARRFIKFYKEKSNEDFFKMLPPLFLREIYHILSCKGYMNKLERLYEKYREEMDNGMYFPNI